MNALESGDTPSYERPNYNNRPRPSQDTPNPQYPSNDYGNNNDQLQNSDNVCGVSVVTSPDELPEGGEPVQNHGEFPW